MRRRVGSTICAGGAFTTVGGNTRNRIAAIDAASGTVRPGPNANGIVYALALNGELLIAGGDFTFIGGQTRNRIAMIDPVNATANSPGPEREPSVYALDLVGDRLIAGGV